MVGLGVSARRPISNRFSFATPEVAAAAEPAADKFVMQFEVPGVRVRSEPIGEVELLDAVALTSEDGWRIRPAGLYCIFVSVGLNEVSLYRKSYLRRLQSFGNS